MWDQPAAALLPPDEPLLELLPDEPPDDPLLDPEVLAVLAPPEESDDPDVAAAFLSAPLPEPLSAPLSEPDFSPEPDLSPDPAAGAVLVDEARESVR